MSPRSIFPSCRAFTLAAVLALNAATFAADAPKPVFETPLMTSKKKPRLLDVDAPLKDAKELYLVVTDEGSISCDWSDWSEPKLIMADGTVKELTTLT